MLLITGAAGFIAGNLIKRLLSISSESIVAVDNFKDEAKKIRVATLGKLTIVDRDDLMNWLKITKPGISFVFHLGARTDTTEMDVSVLQQLNTEYTKKLFNYCSNHQIPIIYASSAATYGSGSYGYTDDEQNLIRLEPKNSYAISKHKVDLWIQKQILTPPNWYGLKFFNVYGPGEENKQNMASMAYHAYHQISETGHVRLFKSEDRNFKHGEQRRDFVYVDDAVEVMIWLWNKKPTSGIYNVGSGKSRTFLELVHCVFTKLNLSPSHTFIYMPDNIKHHYQYSTCAEIYKLRKAGYENSFQSLESGIGSYVDILHQKK